MPRKRKFIDQELIAAIEQCIAATNSTPTTFGKEAVSDHRILATLKRGREVRHNTRKRILSFIAEHLPSDSQHKAVS